MDAFSCHFFFNILKDAKVMPENAAQTTAKHPTIQVLGCSPSKAWSLFLSSLLVDFLCLSYNKTENWTITLHVTVGWIQVAAAPSPRGWKRKIPCCQSCEVYLLARGRRKRDQLTWPALHGMSSALSHSSSFNSQLCALLIRIHPERRRLYCVLFQSCFPGRGNEAAVICGVELEDGDSNGFSVFHVLTGGEWFPC